MLVIEPQPVNKSEIHRRGPFYLAEVFAVGSPRKPAERLGAQVQPPGHEGACAASPPVFPRLY